MLFALWLAPAGLSAMPGVQRTGQLQIENVEELQLVRKISDKLQRWPY
jgi:hypothetical protein